MSEYHHHVQVPLAPAQEIVSFLMSHHVPFRVLHFPSPMGVDVRISVPDDNINRDQLAYAFRLATGREANFY